MLSKERLDVWSYVMSISWSHEKYTSLYEASFCKACLIHLSLFQTKCKIESQKAALHPLYP